MTHRDARRGRCQRSGLGADEWESIQETLFWLSQPGIRETITEAESDIAAGRTDGEDEIRAEFRVPRGDS